MRLLCFCSSIINMSPESASIGTNTIMFSTHMALYITKNKRHNTHHKKNRHAFWIYLFKHSPVKKSISHSIHTRPAPPPLPNWAEHFRQRAIGQRTSPPSPSANQTRCSLFSPAHSIFFRIRMCVVRNPCAGCRRKQNKCYELHKTIYNMTIMMT